MLIIDENLKAVDVNNIHVPTISTHFWTYDFKILDYKLSPLIVLEEIKTPVMTIEIGSFRFNLPCKWNILVSDEDTSQVDLIDVATIAGREFDIVAFNHVRNTTHAVKIRVVDYKSEGVVVSPSIHRHQMLCHPIGPELWINLAPTDMLQKYIKDMVLGNLF